MSDQTQQFLFLISAPLYVLDVGLPPYNLAILHHQVENTHVKLCGIMWNKTLCALSPLWVLTFSDHPYRRSSMALCTMERNFHTLQPIMEPSGFWDPSLSGNNRFAAFMKVIPSA